MQFIPALLVPSCHEVPIASKDRIALSIFLKLNRGSEADQFLEIMAIVVCHFLGLRRKIMFACFSCDTRLECTLNDVPRKIVSGIEATGFKQSLRVQQPGFRQLLESQPVHSYTSRFRTSSALSSMNLRRLSTSSPISVVKIWSLSTRSSSEILSSV